MKKDMNLNIRFPREIYMNYLKGLEYRQISKFCRDAIIDKVNNEFSEQYADEQLEYHNNKLKEWKEKKEEIGKSKSNNDKEIQGILAYHAPSYKRNASEGRLEAQRIDFLKRGVMPDLKRLGCKSTPKEIDDLLINWP